MIMDTKKFAKDRVDQRYFTQSCRTIGQSSRERDSKLPSMGIRGRGLRTQRDSKLPAMGIRGRGFMLDCGV